MADGGVSNGQLANQTTFNNGFMSRNGTQTDTTSKVDLVNADAASGASVVNQQRETNSLNAYTGRAAASAHNATPTWTNNEVGTSGDTLKARAEALTLEFNTTSGHDHDGVNSKLIDITDVQNINQYRAEKQTFTLASAVGVDDVITTQMTGKTAGGGTSTAGVITSAPNNRVTIVNSSTETAIEDAEGQRAYGRITESSGTWTLSYYTNEAGVETAFSMPTQNIRAYFTEVFTLATVPTIGADMGQIPSLDLTADIVDATATIAGKVSIGTQSFGGDKTFTGNVAAANLSGTNTGDVTLAAVGAVPNANAASLSGQVLTLQPADATNPGVMTTGTQTIAGAKTFTGAQVHSAQLSGAITTDAATTGANATLPTPATVNVRVTNASLTSIQTITAPSTVQRFILSNVTGGTVTLVNSGGNITTGSGSDTAMANGASVPLFYDSTSSTWRVYGGGGAVAFTAVGATPNANGASVSGSTITLQPADQTNPGVMTAGQQEIGGEKFFYGRHHIMSTFNGDVHSDAVTTGTNATLTATTDMIRRLTNASLVSINVMSVPSVGNDSQFIVLTNATGNSITVNNVASIITGTGANVVMANGSSLWFWYDTTSTAWRVIGGSGSSAPDIANDLAVAGGGAISISTTAYKQTRRISSSGGAVTASSTPFGTTPPPDGGEILIIGTNDTNNVTLQTNDAADGCILNGDWTSGYGRTLRLCYDLGLDRYLEVSRA